MLSVVSIFIDRNKGKHVIFQRWYKFSFQHHFINFRENIKHSYRPIIRSSVFIISFFFLYEKPLLLFQHLGSTFSILFKRLLLIACESGTGSISEAIFTSFGGILSIPEACSWCEEISVKAQHGMDLCSYVKTLDLIVQT